MLETFEEIIDGFAEVLMLQAELGVRTIEGDRALLYPAVAVSASTPSAPVPPSAPVKSQSAPVPPSVTVKSQSAPVSPSVTVKSQSAPVSPSVTVKSQSAPDFVCIVHRPYTGAALELFNKMLAAMKYDPARVPVMTAEAAAKNRPAAKIYIVFGSEAFALFAPGVKRARGFWTKVAEVPTLLTNSPAVMLKFYADDPAKLQMVKRQCWTDLKSVLARLGRKA